MKVGVRYAANWTRTGVKTAAQAFNVLRQNAAKWMAVAGPKVANWTRTGVKTAAQAFNVLRQNAAKWMAVAGPKVANWTRTGVRTAAQAFNVLRQNAGKWMAVAGPKVTNWTRTGVKTTTQAFNVLRQNAPKWMSMAGRNAAKLTHGGNDKTTDVMEGAQRAAKPRLLLGVAAGLCGLCVGTYLLVAHVLHRHDARKTAMNEWKKHIQEAARLMGGEKFKEASAEFGDANDNLGDWKRSEKKKVQEAEQGRLLAQALAAAKQQLDSKEYTEAITNLDEAVAELRNLTIGTLSTPVLAQWISSRSLSVATNYYFTTNLDEATRWVELASHAAPADPTVKEANGWILDQRRTKRWTDLNNQLSKDLLREWGQYELSDTLTNLLYRDFVMVFNSPKGFERFVRSLPAKYSLPTVLADLSREDLAIELTALRRAASADGSDFAAWRKDLGNRYGPMRQTDLAPDWMASYAALGDLQNQINLCIGTRAACPTNDLAADKEVLKRILEDANSLLKDSESKGVRRDRIQVKAVTVLKKWLDLQPKARSHVQAFDICAGSSRYEWFSSSLSVLFSKSDALRGDSELVRILGELPLWSANGPGVITNQLETFRKDLQQWWERPAVNISELLGLPAAAVLKHLIAERDGKDGVSPNYLKDDKLTKSLEERCKSKRETRNALDALRTSWTMLNSSASCQKAVTSWPPDIPTNLVLQSASMEFEDEVTTAGLAALDSFTNAVRAVATNVSQRFRTEYYNPPPFLGALEPGDRAAEVDKLQAIARGTGGSYGTWRKDFYTSYGPTNLVSLVPEWAALLNEVTNKLSALTKVGRQTATNDPNFRPSDFILLTNRLQTLITNASVLQQAAQDGGKKHQKLSEAAEQIVKNGKTLFDEIDAVEKRWNDVATSQKEKNQYDEIKKLIDTGRWQDAELQLDLCPEEVKRKPLFAKLTEQVAAKDREIKLNRRLLVLQARTGTLPDKKMIVRDEKGFIIGELKRGTVTKPYEDEVDDLEKQFTALGDKSEVKKALDAARWFLKNLNAQQDLGPLRRQGI
jgi:hypothetical protein